jgi:hypothetical protein
MRIIAALAAIALPVLACECAHLTVCELLQLPTIFIGEVIDGGVASVREDPWQSNVDHVRFKVLESFRGLPSGTQTIDVQLTPTFGMCSPIPYFPGRKYLVVPSKRDGKFFDGVCFQGRDVETAADDVRQVREYFAGKMPLNIHGQIAVARHSDLLDFLLNIGEAKPLGGVTISTTRNGQTFSAVTSPDGKYLLALPAPGKYIVQATLNPYVFNPEEGERLEISVPPRGCATKNFGMKVDNSISGSVRDENGQPIKNAKVGLIDLDRPQSDTERHPWFNDAYTEHAGMTFLFENVPIGRYLIVFNPDGPRSGTLFDLPFESTYYPLNGTLTNARTVEVKSGGIHLTGMDLIAGKRVEFRRVVVNVRFPDGTPMKTAAISCTALPREDVRFPCTIQRAPLERENGSAKFLAPVDRKLQIEVKDAYGRNLTQTYTSVHEPGATTVTQEFVVTP